jgi:hypothetical protein
MNERIEMVSKERHHKSKMETIEKEQNEDEQLLLEKE